MAGEATIGALRVELGLDTAKFDEGVADVRSKTQQMANDLGTVLGSAMRGAMGEAAAAIGVVGEALMALGPVGIAVAATIGAAFVGLTKSLKFGNEIADQAKQIGVSTDFLQELGYAVRETGGKTEDAANAMRNFESVLGRAKQEGSQMQRLFEKGLGIDPKEIKTTEQGFVAIQKAVSNIKDETARADIVKRMGLSEVDGVLKMSAAAFADFRQEAHETGSVLDKDMLANADRVTAEMDQLAYTIKVALSGAFLALVPLLVGVAVELKAVWDWCANLVTGIGHVIMEVVRFIGKIGELIAQLAKLAGFKLDMGAMWSGVTGSDVGKFLFPTAGAVGTTSARGQAKLDELNARVGAPPDKTGEVGQFGREGRKGRKGRDPTEASASAIEAAQKAELQARAALTSNIETLADFKRKEIETELAATVRKLEQSAKEGKITQAAAESAVAAQKRAALDRIALVNREEEVKLDQAALAQQKVMLGFAERERGAKEQTSQSAEALAKLETESLRARQEAETRALENELLHKQMSDTLNWAEDREALAALQNAQNAERAALESQQRVRQLQEVSAAEQAALELKIDGLESDLAVTEGAVARWKITEQILAAEKQLEKLKLQEIIATAEAIGDVRAANAARARLAQLDKMAAQELEAARLNLGDTMNTMAGAVMDAASAWRSGDFGGMVTGLFKAFETFKLALANGASKLGAIGGLVAGVAQVAGQAIGGKGGAALSGAAGGAMAGFQLGGPVGAAVGGIIGGISGFLGASKAEKAAKKAEKERKRQEEERRLAEEARKAAEVAAAKRELEIEIMKLAGDTVGALAAERADELAAMDESLRPLQQRIWAMEDEIEMEAKRKALLDQLAVLSGKATAADQQRAKVLAELPESLRPLQKAVWNVVDAEDALTKVREQGLEDTERARDQVIKAYEREANALEQVRDRALQMSYTLQDFKRSLLLDNGLSNVVDNLTTARDRFENIVKLAKAGNQRAFELLPEVGRALIDASRGGAGSEQEFAADRTRVLDVTRELEGLQLDQVSVADAQLYELRTQVAQFVQLNAGVWSVNAAIGNLNTVMAAASAAEKVASDNLAAAFAAAAAASAATLQAINDNQQQTALDVAALSNTVTALANQPPIDQGLVSQTVADAMAANLQPYLLAIARNTGTTADLAQLDRDEAEAAA